MHSIDPENSQIFYKFESPGMLGRYIESLKRRSPDLYDASVIEAFQDGVFLSQNDLLSVGVSMDDLSEITNYVENVQLTTKRKLLEDYPDAMEWTIGTCFESVQIEPRSTVVPRVPVSDASEWGEVPQADTLKPVKSPFHDVLLAVMGDPGTREAGIENEEVVHQPEKYFKAVVKDLSRMDIIKFEYTTVSKTNGQVPFKHLVRIHGLQYFAYIQKWLHEDPSVTGICGVFVPWKAAGKEPGVFVSFGYEWDNDSRVVNNLLTRKYTADTKLLVAEDNGEPVRYFVEVKSWIDGCQANLTKSAVPTRLVQLEVSDSKQIPLEFTVRLENDRTVDAYQVRLNQLKRSIRHLREEMSTVSALLERANLRTHITSLYLYMTEGHGREESDGKVICDLDSSLRALLLDYPTNSLKRLLHFRVGANGLGGGVDGPIDLIIDRTLEAKQAGKGLWAGTELDGFGAPEPWMLSVTYYPCRGKVFDLEPDIYRHHDISLFLPRGMALRPRMDYATMPANKIVDLICSASVDVAEHARNEPDKFLFILLDARNGKDIALLTVAKSAFVPLGNRIDYFNKALAGAEEAIHNLPARHSSAVEAWAFEATESLYRKELLEATKKAQAYLGVLPGLHEDLVTEAEAHKRECQDLMTRVRSLRTRAGTEIGMWEQFVERMHVQRIGNLGDCLTHIASVRDLFDQMCKIVPKEAPTEHMKQLEDQLKNADEHYREIESKLDALDNQISGLTRP